MHGKEEGGKWGLKREEYVITFSLCRFKARPQVEGMRSPDTFLLWLPGLMFRNGIF